jgi:hypothetical protein
MDILVFSHIQKAVAFDYSSASWYVRLTFIIIIAADFVHRVFWLWPRYDEFVAKYWNYSEHWQTLWFH